MTAKPWRRRCGFGIERHPPGAVIQAERELQAGGTDDLGDALTRSMAAVLEELRRRHRRRAGVVWMTGCMPC